MEKSVKGVNQRSTAQQGKKPNQKIKPYVVLQYFLKYSDEEHIANAEDIRAFLNEYGIDAERRGIYKDIEEINKVALMLEEECTIQEAEDMLAEDEDNESRLIVYDCHKKGYYLQHRNYDLNDIRLLAECVYATKFVDEKTTKRLIEVVCSLVSESQASSITHDTFLTDRIKTPNQSIYFNICTISDAMSTHIDGERHTPEKIKFKYMTYDISDVRKQVERRKGEIYVVSPYKLLLSDGNYYLLAYSDKHQEMRHYRVDRMKEISFTGERRSGEAEFIKIDLSNYMKREFQMFGGKTARVTLLCESRLLDVMIEKFGTDRSVSYAKVDENHFTVITQADISEPFFAWICSFGGRVRIETQEVATRFAKYLDKIRGMYCEK